MSKNNGGNGVTAAARRRRVLKQALPAVLVALALVNVLLFVLAVRPAEERSRNERERAEQLRRDLLSRRGNVAQLRDISARLDGARREDVRFYEGKFLPRETGFATIMAEVDEVARANQVRKGTVAYTLNPVPGWPELSEVDISTAVEGEYTNIVKFINQVERSKLFLIIDQIGVAGGSTPGGGPSGPASPRTVRLSLRLVTYFRG